MPIAPYTGLADIAVLSQKVITDFQVKFAAALKAASKFGDRLDLKVTTSQEAIYIPFINKWKQLRETELYGNPEYSTVRAQKIEVPIKRFTGGIEVGRFTYSDPVSKALLDEQVDNLAAEAAYRKNRAIIRALRLGDTDPEYESYDGKQLFAIDHDLNGFPYSNLRSGVLNPTNINIAKTFFQQIPLGEDGTALPVGNAKFILVVPPTLEYEAAVYVKQAWLLDENLNTTGAPVANVLQNIAEIHVDTLLTDPNNWYMIMALPSLKPFCSVKHSTTSDKLIPQIDDRYIDFRERNLLKWLYEKIENTKPIHPYMMIKFLNSN